MAGPYGPMKANNGQATLSRLPCKSSIASDLREDDSMRIVVYQEAAGLWIAVDVMADASVRVHPTAATKAEANRLARR